MLLKFYYNKILTTVQNDPAVGVANLFLVFHCSHPRGCPFAALHKIPVTQAERHIDHTNVKEQQQSCWLFFISLFFFLPHGSLYSPPHCLDLTKVNEWRVSFHTLIYAAPSPLQTRKSPHPHPPSMALTKEPDPRG